MKFKKPELLLPAGSPQAFETALLYGADAIYAGVPALSLRARSQFTADTLKTSMDKAHAMGKKVYLTLNLFTKNADVSRLDVFTDTIRQLSPDGLIVSDPGVFVYMQKKLPDIPLHVSTQANAGSFLTVSFWKDLGADLCVLSRETSFAEICDIKKAVPDIKLEMFVHGAMCMSYSGRCLLSSYLTGRSANRGACAHTCRWSFSVRLEEEKHEGEYIFVEEDERGTYFMNSRDLCLMPKLDKILNAGIDSLKIEGRTKTPYYVAQTARAYRQAIDDWFENPEQWSFEKYQKQLDTLQHRGYTYGFFDGPDPRLQNYDTSVSDSDWRNAGFIRQWRDDGAVFELCHKVNQGDVLVFLPPFEKENASVGIRKVIDADTLMEAPFLAPGRKNQAILIPDDFFAPLSRKDFPVFTVARTLKKV